MYTVTQLYSWPFRIQIIGDDGEVIIGTSAAVSPLSDSFNEMRKRPENIRQLELLNCLVDKANSYELLASPGNGVSGE
jgi:hypothetical protein